MSDFDVPTSPADSSSTPIFYARRPFLDGRDPDFQRGEAANDLWWGDPAYRGGPRATLGPLGEGPYDAIEVKSGALGTKGGPRTGTRSRVPDVDGRVIPVLYCAGNAMASPMGMTYGGAGGTLGPAMVFGYLAGKNAATRVVQPVEAMA